MIDGVWLTIICAAVAWALVYFLNPLGVVVCLLWLYRFVLCIVLFSITNICSTTMYVASTCGRLDYMVQVARDQNLE